MQRSVVAAFEVVTLMSRTKRIAVAARLAVGEAVLVGEMSDKLERRHVPARSATNQQTGQPERLPPRPPIMASQRFAMASCSA